MAPINLPAGVFKLYLLPVRIFLDYRQHILDTMIRIRDDIKPDLVIMPSLNDTHQDHNVVSNEGFRAFKRNSILGYETGN